MKTLLSKICFSASAIGFFSLLAILTYYSLGLSDDEILDKESYDYVNHAIIEIIRDWDLDTYLKYAEKNLIKKSNRLKMENIFRVYKKLGRLERYYNANGESNITLTVWPPFQKEWLNREITANYIAYASFSAGNSKISVSLIKIDDNWYFTSFNVQFLDYLPQSILKKV